MVLTAPTVLEQMKSQTKEFQRRAFGARGVSGLWATAVFADIIFRILFTHHFLRSIFTHNLRSNYFERVNHLFTVYDFATFVFAMCYFFIEFLFATHYLHIFICVALFVVFFTRGVGILGGLNAGGLKTPPPF